MSRERELIEMYIKGYNSFNIKKILMPLHSKIVFESYKDGKLQMKLEGQKQFKKKAVQGFDYHSKRNQEILNIETKEGVSNVLINYSWTLKVDLGENKAGQTINQTGKAEYHFKDDRISKIVLLG